MITPQIIVLKIIFRYSSYFGSVIENKCEMRGIILVSGAIFLIILGLSQAESKLYDLVV